MFRQYDLPINMVATEVVHITCTLLSSAFHNKMYKWIIIAHCIVAFRRGSNSGTYSSSSSFLSTWATSKYQLCTTKSIVIVNNISYSQQMYLDYVFIFVRLSHTTGNLGILKVFISIATYSFKMFTPAETYKVKK